MSKIQTVMNYIAEREHVADVWHIVEELRVSPSTVRRAIKELTELGAVKDGQWVGRGYIPFDEIAPFIDSKIGTFLTDAFYVKLVCATYARNIQAVALPIHRALEFRQLVFVRGGFAGGTCVRRV